MTSPETTKPSNGVVHSIAASIVFAMMPAYLQWLPPLHGYAVIGQRIFWTTIIIAVVLLVMRQLATALSPLKDIKTWPGLIVGALLVGVQWAFFSQRTA